MNLSKEAENALMFILQFEFVNEWHDGDILIGDKEAMTLPVLQELLKGNYLDMSSGNHLYTTYKPTSKAREHTFIL